MRNPDGPDYHRVWRALREARDYLIGPGSPRDRLEHAWGRCSEIEVLVRTGCAAPDWLVDEIEQLRRQRWDQLHTKHPRIRVSVSTLSDEECTEAAQQIIEWCDRLRDAMNKLAD